jgi:DNA-directed RNA polymerase subunit alpha
VLNKSISALELSVRARKALQLLNIQSIGELAARTEAELMGVKNFGSTSLDEIKAKLADFGLGLRTLEEAAATGD